MSLYCSSLLILCIAASTIAQNTLNAVNCCSRIEKSVASFSSLINNTCNGPSYAAIASLQANVSSLQETVSTEVGEVSSNVEAVSSKVSSLQAAVSSEVAQMSTRISAVSSEVSSLKANVSSMQEEVSSKVAALSTKVESVSSKVESVSSKVESVSSEVAKVSSKVASVSSDVSSLQEAVSSLQKAVSSLSADIKKVLHVSSTLATNVSSLERSAVSSLSTDIKKVLNYSSDPFFTSCYDILQKFPDSPSGYYRIVGFSDKVYCHMSSLPYNGNKGWIRIAHLDLYNTKDCPPGFRLIEKQGIRACGRPYSPGYSCVSTYFQVEGFKYSQIHGKLVGYQVGTPDGARSGTAFNINSEYVDGFSLTYGRTRKHIWTFIAGHDNNGNNNYCPCAKWYANPRAVPSFVGNDYYCESGSHHTPAKPNHIYKNDPLWDGWGCGTSEEACCKPTWFSKNINPPTSETIELRLCLDEGSDNEDVYLKEYQIYIR